MVLVRKYSIRNLLLALGFLLVSIFPSVFSIFLGADSVRAGLTLSIAIFFVLAIPFGIRYYITSKIILINISIFSLISVFYLGSSTIYPEVDNFRFAFSLGLLFLMSLAALIFVATLNYLQDCSFHKIIIFGFYLLLCLSCIVVILMVFFNREGKNMLLFPEPSHYAIVFTPFLFYAIYTSNEIVYKISYLITAVVLSIFIQNLTLLAGCLMITFIIFGKSLRSLVGILSIIIGAVFFSDQTYFLQRIDISQSNISMLVFLSGWERAFLNFTPSFGFGVGFQQLGEVGPNGDYQIILQGLHGRYFNLKDGGTLGAKLIAETGFLGLMLLLFYLTSAILIAVQFLLRRINGAKNIFFFGLYLFFSIELFVRGMGYFSLTSFLFISSLYWRHLQR